MSVKNRVLFGVVDAQGYTVTQCVHKEEMDKRKVTLYELISAVMFFSRCQFLGFLFLLGFVCLFSQFEQNVLNTRGVIVIIIIITIERFGQLILYQLA